MTIRYSISDSISPHYLVIESIAARKTKPANVNAGFMTIS